MNQFRFQLEKGSKKHFCPGCEKRRFVRFLDMKTGNYLPPEYGRCDRENGCGYFHDPYTTGYAKKAFESDMKSDHFTPEKTIPFSLKKADQKPVYFPEKMYTRTQRNFDKNEFIQNLRSNAKYPFSDIDLKKVIRLYSLGTIPKGYRKGAITFPFIDTNKNIRAVQVKQFDHQNNTRSTDFLHSILKNHFTKRNKPLPGWLADYVKQDKRVSCLFGEHLLHDHPDNPVALVEAPKTAIYGALYFGLPEKKENLIWLAVYNKSSFSFERIKTLAGRTVFVFPDLSKDGSTFREWKNKARHFQKRMPGTQFIFSDMLERLATEEQKKEGADIADVLIKLNWRDFRERPEQNTAAAKVERYRLEDLANGIIKPISNYKKEEA